MIAETDGHRAGIAEGVSGQQVLEMEFGVETDELEFVHVAVIRRIVTVVPMRVLKLDGEPEGIDALADAKIEAGAMEERLIDAVVTAPDIVVAVFVAEAVIETDVQPLELVELRPSARGSRLHIPRRIRITLRAITVGVPIKSPSLDARPRNADAEQGPEQRTGGGKGHG